MSINFPELPYTFDALAPHISKETLNYHYGKHHKGYVDKVNKAISDTKFQNAKLEDIILEGDGMLLANAAQAWNHTFYWNSMSPKGGGEPGAELAKELAKHFGSWGEMQQTFNEKAAELFGSGWTWLILNSDGKITIEDRIEEGNPMTDGKKPLLTCDVWEHAYYLDYKNERGKYLDGFWQLVNWEFLERNLG